MSLETIKLKMYNFIYLSAAFSVVFVFGVVSRDSELLMAAVALIMAKGEFDLILLIEFSRDLQVESINRERLIVLSALKIYKNQFILRRHCQNI